jgi:oligoribonuclease
VMAGIHPITMKTNPLLVWIDLEMTGLNPEFDRIVEFGLIITDWDFNELCSLEKVVYQPEKYLVNMPSEVVKMHTLSGLIGKISDGISESEAENSIVSLINQYATKGQDVILAGNSIHQDRRFIRKYWHSLEERLHYRMLDVSSWKVIMINKFNHEFQKTNSHRALDDIRGSIQEIKDYLGFLQK